MPGPQRPSPGGQSRRAPPDRYLRGSPRIMQPAPRPVQPRGADAAPPAPGRVVLVSNRLPVTIVRRDGERVVERSVGGLATGLTGPRARSGGVWVRWRGRVTGRALGLALALVTACDRATVRDDAPAARRGAAGDVAAAAPVARDLPTPDPSASKAALGALLRRGAPPAPLDAATWARVRTLYGLAPADAMNASRSVPLRWLDGPGRDADARALLAALGAAHEHAVRLPAVAVGAVAAAAEALADVSNPDARARADALLTGAFAAYGRTMLTGQVAPRSVGTAWYIDPRAVDVDSALARAFRAGDVAAGLAALAPQEAGYPALRAALARYRIIVARGGWPALALTRTLRPGDPLPADGGAAERLTRRLAAEALLDTAAAPLAPAPAAERASGVAAERARYEGALVSAVARFQATHGLAVDSVLGPATRRALDVPAERRLAPLAANLERFRWLPPDFGARYVLVNIPAFRLEAFDGGRRALGMRVVVGDELDERQTPVLADTMTYVQFGPYWNVPAGIARREILSQARRDRGWLARHGYELVRGWGDDAPVVDARRVSAAALMSGRYRVRQRPGPDNALGRVKFMFPNPHAIYLHDTPAQALFDQRVRAASHGCVRVADPAALAAFVLAGESGWTPERVRSALARGERVRVDLARPVPVYLIYLTAFPQGGALVFRADRYDRDSALIAALGAVPDGTEEREALRTLAQRLSPSG